MPDIVNPYLPGQPIETPELFFGRRDVVASIREHLVKGRRVFVVSGAPRMGKSSLLRQLPHHLPEDCVLVRVDLLEESAQHLDWLLWRLADEIAQQARRQLGVEGLEAEWADFEGHTGFLVEKFWPRVRAALGERCLFLALDDVDCLAQAEGELVNNFLTTLATWRDRDADLAMVLTLPPAQQEALAREHGRLFGGALTYTLGPLHSEESTRLITWPVDGVLTYDYGVARRMIEITSGQPYYLQLLCFEIFNRCASAGWVNQRDLDLVIEDLVGREIADFRQIWDQSSPQEQAALAALVSLRGARGVATVQETRTLLNKAGAKAEREQVVAALERLTERGVLERLGALSYRFRVALLRDWLCERLDLEEMARAARWGAVEPARQAGERRIPKLAARRERRRPRPADGESPPGEEEEGQPVRRPAWRPWLWIGAVAVLALVALALVVPALFRPAPETATATAASMPRATEPRASATRTLVPTYTSQPPTQAPPTDTPLPLPTETPSPTPPLVVARSVPSIAYQSREAADKGWFVSVMSSDGSERARLIAGQTQFLAPPTWSPDGSRIAFVSDQDGYADIWVMNSDGSGAVNVTQDEAKDHAPAWSPDGAWIAFASVRDSVYWELYLMRPDGSDVQRLTWWEDASDLSPTWSPDSTRLAFASKRDGNWEIYVMDVDGSNLTRLTDHPADDTNPAWSPDGGRIAFVSTRDGYADVYVMSSVGVGVTNVSNAPFSSEHGPTWSPDGGRMAFYSDREGSWNIFVMASDGSGVTMLTGNATNDQVPAWRP